MDAGVACGTQCCARAWSQHGVLGDQRSVEVAGERLDDGRKVGREL
jgi:hypothetical protein